MDHIVCIDPPTETQRLQCCLHQTSALLQQYMTPSDRAEFQKVYDAATFKGDFSILYDGGKAIELVSEQDSAKPGKRKSVGKKSVPKGLINDAEGLNVTETKKVIHVTDLGFIEDCDRLCFDSCSRPKTKQKWIYDSALLNWYLALLIGRIVMSQKLFKAFSVKYLARIGKGFCLSFFLINLLRLFLTAVDVLLPLIFGSKRSNLLFKSGVDRSGISLFDYM